jgi:hypothetical protein
MKLLILNVAADSNQLRQQATNLGVAAQTNFDKTLSGWFI